MLAAPHGLSPARGLVEVARCAKVSRDRVALRDVEGDVFESAFLEDAARASAIDAFADFSGNAFFTEGASRTVHIFFGVWVVVGVAYFLRIDAFRDFTRENLALEAIFHSIGGEFPHDAVASEHAGFHRV